MLHRSNYKLFVDHYCGIYSLLYHNAIIKIICAWYITRQSLYSANLNKGPFSSWALYLGALWRTVVSFWLWFHPCPTEKAWPCSRSCGEAEGGVSHSPALRWGSSRCAGAASTSLVCGKKKGLLPAQIQVHGAAFAAYMCQASKK